MLAFLFVFLLRPYTAHAMLTGAARIQPWDAAPSVVQRSDKVANRAHFGGGVLIAVRQGGSKRLAGLNSSGRGG